MNKPFYGVATIPKSLRSKILQNESVPGPGSYDCSKDKSHNDLPKWSLKKRINHGSCFQNVSSTPGPDKYKSSEGIKEQKEMIISTKGEKYKNFYEKSYPHSQLHLPGAINPKTGYSFGYREACKDLQKSPGPVYHLDKIVEDKRTSKNESFLNGFGSQKKNRNTKDYSPGPGSFENVSKDSWTNKTCQSWTIGSSKRSGSMPATDIGPGQYNPKFNTTMGRSFKMRGRNEVKPYEPSSLGPGAYNIPDTKTKLGAKINSLNKSSGWEGYQQSGDKSEEILSPCSYNPPRYLDEPTTQGYSLGMKLDEKMISSDEDPGPGTYEVAGKYVKGQCGYMGRKIEKKNKENLSMDNFYRYDPNINTVARQSPKFTFPQGKRQDKQNNRTGYSQKFYEVNDKKNIGYSYSMGTSKRFAQLRKDANPFKDRQTDYSTIGQMPGYLKKGMKKK